MQFHPTGLAHTGILLSEAARAEGGVLRNCDGEAFMEHYAPGHADLAARDVVSRSIMAEIDAGRGIADPKDPDGPKDCVWLDMTGIDADHMHEVLPQVVETIEQYADLDPTRDYVPVKPTAHYTMGGIPITTDGEVYRWVDGERAVVDGLFAAGECSCVSVHGANRLGGNSLLDACLFGTRSGKAMAERVVDNPVNDPMAEPADEASIDAVSQAADKRSAQVKELLTRPSDDDDASSDNPYQLMADLGSVMEQAVAVRCDRNSIEQALATLDDTLTPRAEALHAHSDSPTFNQEITAIWEVRHLLELGKAVLAASDARHESRGSLKRLDFPERDDEHFLAHSMTDVSCQVSWQPVHIVDMPPKARSRRVPNAAVNEAARRSLGRALPSAIPDPRAGVREASSGCRITWCRRVRRTPCLTACSKSSAPSIRRLPSVIRAVMACAVPMPCPSTARLRFCAPPR